MNASQMTASGCRGFSHIKGEANSAPTTAPAVSSPRWHSEGAVRDRLGDGVRRGKCVARSVRSPCQAVDAARHSTSGTPARIAISGLASAESE